MPAAAPALAPEDTRSRPGRPAGCGTPSDRRSPRPRGQTRRPPPHRRPRDPQGPEHPQLHLVPRSRPARVRGYFPANKLAAAWAASKTAPAAQKTLVLAVGETIERLIELVDDGLGLFGRAFLRVEDRRQPHRAQGCRWAPGCPRPRHPRGSGTTLPFSTALQPARLGSFRTSSTV